MRAFAPILAMERLPPALLLDLQSRLLKYLATGHCTYPDASYFLRAG